MHYLEECYRGHVPFSLHCIRAYMMLKSIISDVYLINWSVLSARILHGKITVFPFIIIKYCGGDTLRPYLIEQCPVKIHVYPETQNVALFENRIFADIIKLKRGHTGLG